VCSSTISIVNQLPIYDMKLSVGIITKNEEVNLKLSLEAIYDLADEIIIVDNGSTDDTKKIALQYKAHFYTEEWKGYGKQKNSVLDKCKGEWILLIDADEVVSPELKVKIKSILDSNDTTSVYALNRCSICFGKEIKYGGWSNEYIPRLWKNGSVPTKRISEKLYHYTYHTLEDYFVTFNKYTTLNAQKYFGKNKKTHFFQFTIKPIFAFFKRYILRLGFLDGTEGLLLAQLNAIYVITKYYKLKELNKK